MHLLEVYINRISLLVGVINSNSSESRGLYM